MELLNDLYRKVRGGKAFLIKIYCLKCNRELMVYQKDGDGPLKRCYFNRIRKPEILSELGKRLHESPKNFSYLCCLNCKAVIGAPIRHHDGRNAFFLRPNTWRKERIKK